VTYDAKYLRVIPREVLERDYGCGDPTPYVRAGETVLDLGSGGGKLCFIAAQVVGPRGRVIGVDCNHEMLALARRHQGEVAAKLGYANVEFRCGIIQDLRLDLDLLTRELSAQPVRDQQSWLEMRFAEERLRRDRPLVADASVDCVISNCVLNLVRPEDRRQLFAEIFRVLRDGGRATISDIVSDEDVPEHLRRDPHLWSGCVSGAFREDEFLEAFEEAGFHGVQVVARQEEPWRVVEGIEFRSVTIQAFKAEPRLELDRRQALIYRGPFRHVQDDAGNVFARGERTAVGDRTFELLTREPYAGMFDAVQPREPVTDDEAEPFHADGPRLRDPRESKGDDYKITTGGAGDSCAPGGSCC
jgi:SAM-dependent methyltransferase